MAIPTGPRTSNTRTGAYDSTWLSVFDLELEPQVWGEIYQAYGPGFQIMDWLPMVGNIVGVRADNLKVLTDQALEKAILLGAAITYSGHSAGASRSLYLDATEYLSSSTEVLPYLRVNDSVIIPPAYTNKDVPTEWGVSALGTYNSGSPTATTIYPFDITVALTADVPSGSYLMVGANSKGRGGGQTSGRRTGTTSSTFYSGITDETAEIVGGVNAFKTYREDRDRSGRQGIWFKAQIEAEFLHKSGMDKKVFLGQVNTNTSNLVSTTSSGGSSALKSTKGLWHHLEDSGMEQEFATTYDLGYFGQIPDFLRSQGVTSTEVDFLQGSGLHKQAVDAVLGYIQAYSGGTDLKDAMGVVGANFAQFVYGGIKFNMVEAASFDNAQTYANIGDYLKYAGAIIPRTLSRMDASGNLAEDLYAGTFKSAGEKVTIPNLSLGYLIGNGENRTRMIGTVSGVNGYNLPFMHQYDEVALYIKSEYMLVATLVNQMIKVVKAGTY